MSELIKWAQELQAIAQSGMAYTENPFDKERYQKLSHLAAQIMTAGTGAQFDEVFSVFRSQTGYATPKVDVRGVVFKGKKLLFVRELMDGGKWTLPGGWADVNESPGYSVEREVREEAGMIVKARKVAAVFDRNLHGHPPFPFHTYKLFIICDLIAEATPDPLETAEPTFFANDQIQDLSLLRVTPDEISCMFEHLADPDRPTDFD